MASKVQKIVFDTSFERKFTTYKENLSQKQLKKLREKITIFKNNPFDPRLKTHKLKGKLKDYWVFAISFSDRIIFRFLDKERVFFIDMGDHSIYK